MDNYQSILRLKELCYGDIFTIYKGVVLRPRDAIYPPSPSIHCLPAGRLHPEFPEGPGTVRPHLCGPRLPGPQPAQEAAGANAAEVCQTSRASLPETLV